VIKSKQPEIKREAGARSLDHRKDFGFYSKSNGKLLQEFKKVIDMM
jgi:hypothetical protein